MSNGTTIALAVGLGAGALVWHLTRGNAPPRPASSPRTSSEPPRNAAPCSVKLDTTGLTVEGAPADVAAAVARCRANGRAEVVLAGDASADPWPIRCSSGLSQRDLETLGGQLIVLPQGATPVATLPNMPSELPGALMNIVGGSRAWALAEAGADESTCEIVGFGAGRIVAVRAATEDNEPAAGTWEIVVQPTTLVSSQAVTTPNMNPNPWIGKLELTQ